MNKRQRKKQARKQALKTGVYTPEEFNQLELLDELCNDEIVHYISIKSRGNGKSFNYINYEIERIKKNE